MSNLKSSSQPVQEQVQDVPQRTESPIPLSPTSQDSEQTAINPVDEIIPHPDEVKHRNLILCFDGTGDQFDGDNSNIVQLFSLLKRDDPSRQLVYYQSGIGTYTIPQIAKPWMANLQKTLDAMMGKHLNAHIMAGYEFLMQHFQSGDKIFLFGFSRGAYTARALAGMIHKVGLLPPGNHQQVPFAYNMYKKDTKQGWDMSTEFKKTFSIDVDIEFVGVWDTVASVGIVPRRMPFTKSNSHVRYFRHAISLDERRARFKPNLLNRSTREEHMMGVKKGEMARGGHGRPHEQQKKEQIQEEAKESGEGQLTLRELEKRYTDSEQETDSEEVWFTGAHADVGGGSVKNGTRHSLARIPLRWMIRQLFTLKLGVMFHANLFPSVGLDPKTLYPHVLPRPPPLHYSPESLAHEFRMDLPQFNKAKNYKDIVKLERPFENEEIEDLFDALTPIYDQLKLAKVWWVLELIPHKQRYQKEDRSWAHSRGINLGGARALPEHMKDVKVHRTVQLRMEADGFFKDKHYQPAAKFDFDKPQWVA